MPVPSVQPAEAKPVQVALASPAPAPAPRQDIKPAETVAAAPAAISADADGNYTVTAGDTLYSIARRFDIGLDDLKTVNGMDSNIVKVGQVLNINKPIDKGVSVTLLADNSRANAQQDALLKVSGLQTSQRATGSVPAEYVVQRGDTLFSIARRFGVNHNDIQRWNDSAN